jgi:phosphoribosylglycinamide formyltransferase-1
MSGFDDTVKSGAHFVGATVHFVDSGADTGLPILQSAVPYDPHRTVAENRHHVFLHQCRMLLQTVKWFEEGRIERSGRRVVVRRASYNSSEFAPNLDFDLAVGFDDGAPQRG